MKVQLPLPLAEPVVVVAVARCDKGTRRSPCDMTEVDMLPCECGKVYERCRVHGGEAGAERSRRAHWTLGCTVHENAKYAPKGAPWS